MSDDPTQRAIEACHAHAADLERLGKTVGKFDAAMNRMFEQGVELSEESAAVSQATRERCRAEVEALENMERSLEALSTLAADIAETVTAVRTMRDEVVRKSKQVQSIAFQSHVLSLNASVEAARAGEHGRGFAVVADAIGRLALDSRTAANEIGEIVSLSTGAIERLASEAQGLEVEQTRVVRNVRTGLEEIMGGIERVSEATQRATGGIGEERRGLLELTQDIRTQVEGNSQFVSDLIGKLTGAEILDIDVHQAAQLVGRVKIIDVRRPKEFNDELGHIQGAELITVGDDFRERLAHLDPDAPTLFVCRSGGRSSRGARLAQVAGFKRVANMLGGMLKWRDANLPSTHNRPAPPRGVTSQLRAALH